MHLRTLVMYNFLNLHDEEWYDVWRWLILALGNILFYNENINKVFRVNTQSELSLFRSTYARFNQVPVEKCSVRKIWHSVIEIENVLNFMSAYANITSIYHNFVVNPQSYLRLVHQSGEYMILRRGFESIL